MPIASTRLLSKLEPPVRPITAPARSGADTRSLERLGFDDLLALVARGDVRSEAPVSVRADAGLPEPLTDDQLERLAAGADLAASVGARRAVLLLDGRGLVLDVNDRAISGELAGGSGPRHVELDAAVYVAGPDDEAPVTVGRPGHGLPPPGVAAALARDVPPG